MCSSICASPALYWLADAEIQSVFKESQSARTGFLLRSQNEYLDKV